MRKQRKKGRNYNVPIGEEPLTMVEVNIINLRHKYGEKWIAFMTKQVIIR
ncbi:hypothetical protein V6Z12_A11G355700 [Gossypium hirsutum]